MRQINVLCLEYRVFSCFFLQLVILECADCVFAEDYDDRNVDDCHCTHCYICNAPEKVCAETCTYKNNDCRNNVICILNFLYLLDMN